MALDGETTAGAGKAWCPACGDELAQNARFCPKDGTTVRPESEPTRAPASSVAPAESPSPPATGSVDDPLLGCVLDGRYRVLSRLGQGGVGSVYEGEHVEIKKPVAIKVLHGMFAGTAEFQQRFEREARAASRLSHPGCVSVLDFGRVKTLETPTPAGAASGGASGLVDMPYLVLEFVRGRTLSDRLAAQPAGVPLDLTEACLIARGVLSALRHAHGHDLVHRDVKPANIMLVDGGSTGLLVKLLDFGLAKELSRHEGSRDGGESPGEPLTQAGMVFGTPGYLSPEQAAGSQADARSDLYAVGVVLYEMICGRRLFPALDPIETVRAHLSTAPAHPQTVNARISNALALVVVTALEKDPARRFQSAQALQDALGHVPELGHPAEAAPVVVGAAPPGTSARRWSRPRRGAIALGGALALVTAALYLTGRRPPASIAANAPPIAALPTDSTETDRALALAESGQADQAVSLARRALARAPHDAAAHRALASAYQRKLWCSDALEELERALRDGPELRDDPQVARTAIGCLTPKTQARAIRFLRERVGAAAAAPLRAAASSELNPEIRRAAERALESLGHP
jgi:serine/threonine-protein kinase